MDEHTKAGGRLETLFDYNKERKTWKLKSQYHLSEAALQQRRAAARRPRKKEISGDGPYGELMTAAVEIKEKLCCLMGKISYFQKRAIGDRGGVDEVA